MRFYTKRHKHYCGIDLHARSMYVCVMNQEGDVLMQRALPCEAERFLDAIRHYREDMVVGVECIFLRPVFTKTNRHHRHEHLATSRA